MTYLIEQIPTFIKTKYIFKYNAQIRAGEQDPVEQKKTGARATPKKTGVGA